MARKNPKIVTLLSPAMRKDWQLDKPYLKNVTMDDFDNLALALKERTLVPGIRAGQFCCCCAFCCCSAAAVVPDSGQSD